MKRLVSLVVGAALLLAACGGAPGAENVRSAPSQETVETSGPQFNGTIERIDAELREEMTGVSWHQGCPVPIRQLRLLTLDYRGFDGDVHRGRLIVRRRQAKPVLGVFHAIFDARFEIRRVRMVEPSAPTTIFWVGRT